MVYTIKNRYTINNKFAIYSTIVLTILSFVIGWGNFNYTVFWYFHALLMLFQIAQTYRMEEPFTVPDPRRCGILTRLGCFG
jgi:hypothetical protein